MSLRSVSVAVTVGALLAFGPVPGAHGAGGPVGDAFPDFNGDGYADLVTAATGEDYAGAVDAGVVHVLFGSAAGTTTTGTQMLSSLSAGIAVTATEGFGKALAYGDFNGDGRDDLAVGAPEHDRTGKSDSGRVYVFYGASGAAALGTASVFDQDVVGVPDSAETGDAFGATLRAGDFNSDGRDDLVIGVPHEGYGGMDQAGAVYLLWGRSGGLSTADDLLLTEATAGVESDPHSYDWFGGGLAAGDVDGDGHDDLIAAAPATNIGAATGAGLLHVLFGSNVGFDLSRDRLVSEDTSGVPDGAEFHDYFGTVMATGDFDGNGRDEIAVGVATEDFSGLTDVGAVTILDYRASGTPWSGTIWHENTPGVVGYAESGDDFGFSLATGDFDGDGHDDLAAGVPGKRVGWASEVGQVVALYGGSSGVSASGNEALGQDTSGMRDTGEPLDFFGEVVRALDANGDGDADLAIGVPDESTSSAARSGVMHVVFGGYAGLSPFYGRSVTNLLFSQDTPGVPGGSEADDAFGH